MINVKLSSILFSALLLMSLSSFGVENQKVQGAGERSYGPNETQASACSIAEANAKRDALARHFGELIGQQTLVDCDSKSQKVTGNECELFESTWSLLNANGFIKGAENRREQIIFSEELRANVCLVSATYLIEEFPGQIDPGFNVDIEIPAGNVLRAGEMPTFSVASSYPAHHAIFYWAPYVDEDNYYLLYPNELDQQVLPVKKIVVPSNNRTADYGFEATLPAGLPSSAEYLILVSFLDKPGVIPSKLSQGLFMAWLQAYDRSRWSKKKYSYRVIGE